MAAFATFTAVFATAINTAPVHEESKASEEGNDGQNGPGGN